MLDPERLGPDVLAGEIERLLEFMPRQAAIDLDGARESARILWDLTALEATAA